MATQYLYGGLRVGGPSGGTPRTTRAARVQLTSIAAVLMLLIAASYWLDRYSILMKSGQKFVGASFTDVHAVIPSKAILAGIAIFVAVMFIVTAIRGNWRLPAIGVGLMIVAAIAVGGIYPAVVQRFQVQPNQQDAEAEYIQRNIEATLDAYGLDDVKTTEYDAEVTAEAGALREDADTTASIRLLDPQIVSPSFKQLEQIRAFYDFPDSLSVDRYEVNGESRDTVIAVRELSLEGLDAQQRNWTNDTTVYTHGFGVVAAYGNTTAGRGAPDFWEGGIPSTGDMGEYEPRIYFSPKAPDVLDRRSPRGRAAVGAGLPVRRRHRRGEQHVPDAGRLRRAVDRQPVHQAALRAEVRLGADRVLRPRDQRLADPLRPRPARPRAEGRPLPDARRPRVPGRRRRQGQVDRRRLHDDGPVPVRGLALARRRDDGLPDRVVRDRPGAPAEDRQLHPELGEGHGRRLRRLGHPVRLGHRGPDPQGLGRRCSRRRSSRSRPSTARS